MGQVASQQDYERLAQLSERHGIAFETLCERWERGLRGDKLVDERRGARAPIVAPAPTWARVDDVAEIFGVSLWCIRDLATKKNGGLLKRLTNGSLEETGRPTVYKRDEVLEVRRIRDVLDVPIGTAIKVFMARREGLL